MFKVTDLVSLIKKRKAKKARGDSILLLQNAQVSYFVYFTPLYICKAFWRIILKKLPSVKRKHGNVTLRCLARVDVKSHLHSL